QRRRPVRTSGALRCATLPPGMPRRRFQSAEVIVVLAVTVAVFAYQSSLGSFQREIFDDRFGAVPTVMWGAWHSLREHGFDRGVLSAALPLITANFLHADAMHIGANMLFF